MVLHFVVIWVGNADDGAGEGRLAHITGVVGRGEGFAPDEGIQSGRRLRTRDGGLDGLARSEGVGALAASQ